MRMNQKTIVLIVALFVLIVVGMFMYAYLKKTELVAEPLPQPEPTKEEPVPYPDITRIDAKHYYIDGVHTLVGEVNMPTPCDLLEAKASVMESYPEQIQVSFTVINNAETCAQRITPQRFQVEASASESATFGATFMGRPIDLNLIPAGPNERPEDFEVYYKG